MRAPTRLLAPTLALALGATLAACDGAAGPGTTPSPSSDPATTGEVTGPSTSSPLASTEASPGTFPQTSDEPSGGAGETPSAASSATTGAGDPTSGAETGSEDSGLESSVGTSTSDVQSSVEVRVADIISDFDGETTTTGTELTIPGEVLFDTDEDTLRPQARRDLDKVVEVLEFYEDAPVEIVGHTDSRSSDRYNQRLSERRARAVSAYLRDAGIPRGRMTVEGRGESEPVATNDTAAGRQRNRRVVVTVVGVEPPEVE